MQSARVYLDWNATTPPHEEVIEAMAETARSAWGNPASVHSTGRMARARVESAREAAAAIFGADARDVIFTSGGTEANNLAVRSAFVNARSEATLVTSRLEHPSITRVAEALEREGRAQVVWVRVLADGRVDLEEIERVLAERPVSLVALQAVNHETGVIQPVAEVIALAHARGARVHVDAVQAVGRLAMNLAGADSYALAAHKIRGPKGIGALLTKPGLRIEALLLGGGQERGIRPGTVDPVAAAGFAVALRRAATAPSSYATRAALRDRIEVALLGMRPGAAVNGSAARAPHVSNVFLPGWNGPEVVAALDLEGVAVSSGSACSAGTSEPSPVLAAMFPEDLDRARSSVRVSLGEETASDDVDAGIAAFARVLSRGAHS